MLESDRTETVEPEVPRPPAAPGLSPGTVVGGRYELRETLGRGGYAVVYRAFDRSLRRDVALKVLRPERIGPTPRARLRREAAVAREVSSAHLVRIFDVELGEDLNYLTMEVVDGGSLSERLGSGPLPIADVLRIAEQSLEGLAELHALGIAHRDIKPGNILLTARGSVKLADFGLALRWASDETRATVGDTVVGTIDYLAPEQILGRDADERSDLYSLGVVLFELLTGELPYRAGSSLGALIGHVRKSPSELRALRADVPPFLAEVIAGLLAKEPRQRYPSAKAVLHDLRAGNRWRSRRLRGRAARVTLVLTVLAGLAAIGARSILARQPRFSHLVRTGDGDASAIGRDGAVLWSLPAVDPDSGAVAARLHAGEPSRVVAILRPRGVVDGSVTRMLSVLDADTGSVLRTVELATGAHSFPAFADQYFPVLRALDLDGDGLDEIVASYFHNPYWPSYTVLYEPKIERSRLVLLASGHHRFAGAEDLDGDGRKELLFFGINNRMGWYSALAAVRIAPAVNTLASLPGPWGDDDRIAGTPDGAYTAANSQGLFWYSLGPRLPLNANRGVAIDRVARTIRMRYADNSVVEFDWNGFLTSVPATLPGPLRSARRSEAYAQLTECSRLTLTADFPAQAVADCNLANASAIAAGDPYLVEWTTRALGKALIAQGATVAAEKTFGSLLRTSSSLSDAAFDAATSFHLRGQLDRAIAWYRRGFGPGALDGVGRGKYEFVEGEVLALAELGRWGEAQAEIDRFARLYPMDVTLGLFYEQFVQWRQGSTPEIAELGDGASDPDLQRYWLLEFRRARHEDASELLRRIDSELVRSSETVGLLRSLRAEVLAVLGRPDEAVRESRQAVQLLRSVLSTNTAAATHYALVAGRYAEQLRATGQKAEAEGVLEDLRSWRRARLRANGA